MQNYMKFQKDFFTNLHLDNIVTDYAVCKESWCCFDYIPDYNKLYLICEGEGWLKIKGFEFKAKPGQLYLLPEGFVQSYCTAKDKYLKKYWCHFSAKIGDINLFDIIDFPYFIDNIDFVKAENLFKELIDAQNDQSLYSRLREKSVLLEIVSYYLKCANSKQLDFSNFNSMEKLNNVLKYIQENISNNITIDQLAEIMHFHPNYFTKLFKKYMGIPPIQYINKIRLEKAKNLLKTSNMSIQQIASATGFCDIYHFSKTFKSYTGFSPSEYKTF